MKIIVLTGSPHPNGTSAKLVEEFLKGGTEAGNQVERFDTAILKIHPCLACGYCRRKGKGCIQQDDMQTIYKSLLQSDVIVFASPLYYYGLTAQLKTALDRFYAISRQLKDKEIILLLAFSDDDISAADGVLCSFRSMCDHLSMRMSKTVFAKGCPTADSLDAQYLQQAYEIGKRVGMEAPD